MASIVIPPANLTASTVEGLLNKIDAKATQVREVEISDSESTHEEITVIDGEVRIGIVDHVAVRSSLHKEAVHLRSDLQLHLRSVMRTGDDMLVKIRGVIEELDTAVHARQLAEGELLDAEAKRDILKKQLEQSTRECNALRIALLEMSKARDRAEIELESARGLLLEKTEECNELKRESARLHIQIAEISQKLLEYTSRLSEAEKKIRYYISEVSKLKLEMETYKTEIVSLTKQNITLGEELKVTRFENKDLKITIEKLRVELISYQTRLTKALTDLETLKVEVDVLIKERDAAVISRDQAYVDRDEAIAHAEAAVIAREDAIVSRDQAIYTEKMTAAKWIRDSALLEDAQRSLTTIRITVTELRTECAEYKEKAGNYEHLRDEALEHFHEADKERHSLAHKLHEAREAKKKAHEDVRKAKEQVVKIVRERDVVIKEKEQVELVLIKTEREKSAAIAAQLKTAEEYIEADRQRDEAIAKYEMMEDLWQETKETLALTQQALETTQAAEQAAVFKVEQLTTKLNEVSASETSLKTEKIQLLEKLKTAESSATQAKNDLTTQTGRLNEEKAHLQAELKHVQGDYNSALTKQEELVTEKTALQKQVGTLTTDRDTYKTSLDEYKKKFDSVIKEKDRVRITNIFFGAVRITNEKVYQTVLDSYAAKDPQSFTVNTKFLTEGSNTDTSGHRHLVVYYSVHHNNKWVDRLPVVYEENTTHKFKPQFPK